MLERGYALVSDVSGTVLTSAAAARAAGALSLGFADGDVPVLVSDGAAVPPPSAAPSNAPPRRPRAPSAGSPPGQASLFD